MPSRSGILYLISGPSGSGKTTLCRRLASEQQAEYAISCTTRAPREGESHGVDYYFLSIHEFKSKIEKGEFLEFAEVHGNYYGTLLSEVVTKLESGKDVVMDIDVQGAALVRNSKNPSIKLALVDLFIMPPTVAELRKRLTGRGTDSDEVIELRMNNSLEEMAYKDQYSYLLCSGTHEEDYLQFLALLQSQRLMTSRLDVKTLDVG
ncbi:guanylate kinase [Rubritalea marina]|uniref:guanylate kinase n=1 Tax=Rubritalea marina TaxID=361055 RepID=UPI00036289A7|nr:guanylate kinase [Rubritalea marina]